MKANMPEKAQDRAAFTYNAAADFYDASALSFWDYFGRRTIELLSLPSGARMLDVCCGSEAGVASPKIIAENRLHTIKSPDDWWTIVLGSGYRGTIELLNLADRQRVKEADLAFVRDENISAVETNVLYALATKPETTNLK